MYYLLKYIYTPFSTQIAATKATKPPTTLAKTPYTKNLTPKRLEHFAQPLLTSALDWQRQLTDSPAFASYCGRLLMERLTRT